MPIKAVIFDLYKTLIYFQTEAKYYHKLFKAMDLNDEEYKNAKKLALTKKFNDLKELSKAIKPHHYVDAHDYEKYVKMELNSAVVFSETRDVLEELQSRDFQLGLISNATFHYESPLLTLDLDKYFSAVIFSFAVGMTKPNPDIFNLMLKKLNVSADETVMVGDNWRQDIEGARSVNIQTIYIDRENKHPEREGIKNLKEIFNYL